MLFAVCALAVGVAVPNGAMSAEVDAVPAGTLLVPAGSHGQWLQTRRLDGTGVRDVTRRVSRYEQREDEYGSFSPEGTTITFRRKSTRDRVAIMVAGLDGTGIRRVLTLAQANRIVPGADGLGAPLWAPDGRSVVVATRYLSCSTRAVLAVGLDGTRPEVLWRPPGGASVTVSPVKILLDGTVLVAVSENDGDCYFGHTGPDRLLLLRSGSPPRALGRPSSAIGEAVVTPDGRTVAWAADCLRICQIWAADIETGSPRRLTTFRTRTVPLFGYDSIAMAIVGADTLVFGRGRSVYARPLFRAAAAEELVRLPCPRKAGCTLSEIGGIVTSPDGAWMVVDVTDHGCEVCEAGSYVEPVYERFAVSAAGNRRTRLPALPLFDIRFD